MKILIVEDNGDTALGIAQLIRVSWQMDDVPLNIVCVTNLKDALAEAKDANVTILDLGLPDSKSEETVERICEFQPPVIVVTGDDDKIVSAKCMAAGAAHVFIKGSLIGFIPSFFASLQKDVVRRAKERHEQKK